MLYPPKKLRNEVMLCTGLLLVIIVFETSWETHKCKKTLHKVCKKYTLVFHFVSHRRETVTNFGSMKINGYSYAFINARNPKACVNYKFSTYIFQKHAVTCNSNIFVDVILHHSASKYKQQKKRQSTTYLFLLLRYISSV